MSKISMPTGYRGMEAEEIEYDAGIKLSEEGKRKLYFLAGVVATACVVGYFLHCAGGVNGARNNGNVNNQNNIREFDPQDPWAADRMDDAAVQRFAQDTAQQDLLQMNRFH